MNIPQDQSLRIADAGIVRVLDYQGLLAFHAGDSWWGCSVGFRALQFAGLKLSEDALWDRESLSVVSGHPGPGVKDAIEFVTRCISRRRFRLSNPVKHQRCSREMRFEWWVSEDQSTIEVRLRADFVPEEFFVVLDRLRTPLEKSGDRKRFEDFKHSLSDQLWREPLESLYCVRNVSVPLTSVENVGA